MQTTRRLQHVMLGCEYNSCIIFQRCQFKFWLRDQILAKLFCVYPHFLQVNAVVHCHYRIWKLSCQFQEVLFLMGHAVAQLVEALHYKPLQARRSRVRFLMVSLDFFIEMSTRNVSWGQRQPVRRANNLTTFICRLSWNLGASTSWKP